ncbi:MAG: hypothetical protein ACOCV2_07600 [Persicimonas sp.]
MKYLCTLCSRVLLALVLILAVASGCGLDDDKSDQETSEERATGLQSSLGTTVCGKKTLPSPGDLAEDTCKEGEQIVSESFANKDDNSGYVEHNIELEEDSRLCFTVEDTSTAKATVKVDGEVIIDTDEFGNSFDGKRYSLDLPEGKHKLEVDFASSPGETIDVTAKASPIDPVREMLVGQNNILEVTNIAVDHLLFSPNADGYHDTTIFNADNYPRELPGEDTGNFDYHLEWKWNVTDAETCQDMGPMQSGTEQVNSPTNVQALWDGSESGGSGVQTNSTTSSSSDTVVEDGSYLYQYEVDLVRSDGLVIDTAKSDYRGLLVDTHGVMPDISGMQLMSDDGDDGDDDEEEIDFYPPEFDGECDPDTDPDQCECPDSSSLDDNVRCTYAEYSELQDFDDPDEIGDEVITSTYDDSKDRWVVVADLREFNGGGLVPQSDGQWQDVDELQEYISDLTGVPEDPDDERLFNFDFIQHGYSTGITEQGMTNGFNHLLLDAITNPAGELIIGGVTVNVGAALYDDASPYPSQYHIDDDRDGDQGAYNGNSDGDQEITAKGLTKWRMAHIDPAGSDLGIYRFENRIFELEVDGEGTTREEYCDASDCRVRTFQRNAAFHVDKDRFVEAGGNIDQVDEVVEEGDNSPAILIETDRHWDPDGGSSTPIDGECTTSMAIYDSEYEVPLDSADGALPGTCIVNGVWGT